MPCYHPRIRIENLTKWQKAADGHLYHPARIEQPDDIHERLEELKTIPNYKKAIIPCRQCIGCRLDYSREWANRGFLEAKKTEHNYFVTLTYDDDHKPYSEEITTSNGITYTDTNNDWNGHLNKEHLTDFLHDIRQIFKRDYNHTGIKFLSCGEYGGETQRPHYHLILFNAPFPADTMYHARLLNKNFYWQNSIIERAWNKGLSNITTATWDTIAYVARYVTKKIYGKESEEEYAQRGQTPEFIRMSRGIGKDYYEANKERIWKDEEIIVKNTNGAVSQRIPNYFVKLLEKENEEKAKTYKKHRKKIAETNAKVKDQSFSMGRLEHLKIEERTHDQKALSLKRKMEAEKKKIS